MPNSLVVEEQFPANYQFAIVDELPGDANRLNTFDFGSASVGEKKAIVRIAPADRNPWYGKFEHAYGSPPAISRIFTCPKITDICVICSGQGYLVDVRHPRTRRRISCFPIISAMVSVSTKQI